MKELLKAFPTIHQERKLTSLEKGRMALQVLDNNRMSYQRSHAPSGMRNSYGTLDPSMIPGDRRYFQNQ